MTPGGGPVGRRGLRRLGPCAAIVVLVLVCLPAQAAAQMQTALATGPTSLDVALLESVVGTALNFLGPRTLEPYSDRQFSLWGLGGLTALDPSLTVESRDGLVRLLAADRLVTAERAPADADLAGWTELVGRLTQAAWQHSDALRMLGQPALIQSFFDELCNHLDPYSRYVAPVPARSERSNREGATADCGITVVRSGRTVLITAVNANGPAWAAGLSAGQRLLAIDGRPTRGRDLGDIQQALQGRAGSAVSLTVAPAGRGLAQTVSISRAQVPPETVFAFSSGDIVVLRITGFSSDTAEEMSQFLDQASQAGSGGSSPGAALAPMRGLVFDLRGNRGGLLQQAVTAVALVLDHGVAVVTRGRDPDANHIWAVRGGDLTGGVPIVVLVDGRTASAAEIMAAALADHRRAVVVGSATLGKGLVQTIAQLPDGGELFVTWSRVLAPLGWPLQGLGVMPEICTSLGGSALGRTMAALARGDLDSSRTLVAERRLRPPVPAARIMEIRATCPPAIGSDTDLDVAKTLIDDPTRYHAALLPDAVAAAVDTP